MRIAIDARMINPGSMHGIARYVYQLLQCLISIGQNHQFYIIVNPDSPLTEVEWPKHMSLKVVKGTWFSLRQQWELPRFLRSINADLFHAPSFMAPLVCPCPLS